MKKLLITILILLTVLSLCACESGKGAATGSDLSWDEMMALAE